MDKSLLDEVAEFLGENGSDELLLTSHELLTESEELLASNEAPTESGDASNTAKSSEKDKQKAVPKGKLSAEKRREIRNAQATKRRLRYRQSLKEERETLKHQASELSSQLQELEAAREEQKARLGGRPMFAAWRALAVRQLERRVQAEQQRKLLRAELVGKARLIHQMNVQLHEVLQSSRVGPCGLIETSIDASGEELFRTMVSELDGHYARIDEVFQGLEFKMSAPATYTLTRKWQEGVLYLDSADRMVFPYSFEHTANAMSIVMMSGQDEDMENVQIQDIKDTLTVKFHAKYQFKPEQYANVDLYGAARRYQAKDRIVFVWRCFVEGRGEIEGFNSNETLWMVIRPGESELEGTSTVVECYARLVPMGFGGCDEDMDKFVRFLVKSGEEESRQMVEMMEKLLICEP